MKIKILLATGLLIVCSRPVFAQGFQPPAEGKAVIYFVRVTSMGAMASFEYFDKDKYFAVAKGKNYVRYECDPGERLLWLSSENKEFLTVDFQAGKTYMAIVNVEMGVMKGRVGLTPLTDKSNPELFERAKKLINQKKPVVTSQEKIDQMNIKLKDFIAEKLNMYDTQWKDKYQFGHISSDMAISAEALK